MVVLSAPANAGETQMADTINAGTMLVEQSTLLPESLRFESEPWTFLYTAGGMIRELRKVQENKERSSSAQTSN